MKKKTAYQEFICSIQPKLKPVSAAAINWGFKNCFERRGVIRRKTAHCLECGHSWKPAGDITKLFKKCTCPECGSSLKMEQEPGKLRNSEAAYYDVITTIGDIQVVRLFFLTQFCKVGAPAKYQATEVIQHFLNEKAEIATFSMKANSMSYAYDQWIYSSKLELETSEGTRAINRSYIGAYKSYPRQKVIPILTRNGYTGNTCGHGSHVFFKILITQPEIETLLKAGQFSLIENWRTSKPHWDSIKICLRNGYHVQDATIWTDYLELLKRYKKDLRNSVYVCPADLHTEHNALMKRRNKEVEEIRRRQEYALRIANEEEKKRKEAAMQENQQKYAELKSKFFSIGFTDGKYTVSVLQNVEEFKKESDALNHCVFGNEYYKKPDSLILSARIDGEPIETAEISLKDFRIVQCRGYDNKPTLHHREILRLINRNLNKIRKVAG